MELEQKEWNIWITEVPSSGDGDNTIETARKEERTELIDWKKNRE